ncbi:Hpt domain-containing protein [bacterium]|nr:Hpt domain-containing protein [bacterium]
MPTALSARLAMLASALEPRAQARGLALKAAALPASLSLDPSAEAQAAAGLRALAEAVLARAGGGGELGLGAGVALCAGERRLRLLAADSLPGLSAPAQPAAFAYLAGEGPAPAGDPLGLGDLARRLPAGALDFLSRPEGSLIWLDLPLAAALAPSPALPGWSRRACLEPQDLLRRLGGDKRIAGIVIASFREVAPRQLAALAAACDEFGERQEAIRLAHSLKGASRNTGGLMLGEVAAAVEAALQQERLAEARACLPRLEWELARLDAAWGPRGG